MSLNRAIQRELDSFFKKTTSSDFSTREATKGAFYRARSKLNSWSFECLNEVARDTFYDGTGYNLWQGIRLLAVDGIRLMLPNHPIVREEFGVCSFGFNADSPRSMVLASMLYDVLNLVTIDAKLASRKKSSERALLEKHFSKLEENDLLLLDRKYPCILLFFQLMAMGVYFRVRMKGSWWKEVRAFMKSNEREMIVSFTLPRKDDKKLMDCYPEWVDKEIKCRLVKVE